MTRHPAPEELLEESSLRFNLPSIPFTCYLCGVDENSVDSNFGGRDWHFRLRAVIHYRNGPVSLEGPGLFRGLGGRTFHSLPNVSIFCFHDACWHLLLKHVASASAAEPDPLRVAEHLLHLVRCLPANGRSITIPAHDYGGAAQVWGREEPFESHLQYLIADPTSIGRFPLLPKPDRPLLGSVITSNSLSTECFAELPEELVPLIARYLRIVDLQNARLASRTFARLVVPAALPPSFWSSRFATDMEMGFLGYDRVPEKGAYCRNAYFHVSQGLLDSTCADSIRNRFRIWQCLRHYTNCLIPLLEQHGQLGGTATTRSWKEHAEDREIQQTVSGNERLDSKDPEFHDGIGFRLYRVADFRFDLPDPDNDDIDVKVGVSFITFNCTRYVRGLRLLSSPPGSSANVEANRVGLILSKTEMTLNLGCGNTITAVRIATALDGVVGISFGLNDKDDCFLSAGTTEDLPAGVGIATMRPSSCRRQAAGLLLGFDVCKIVAVGLLEEEGLRPTGVGKTFRGYNLPCGIPLWHPAEPSTKEEKRILPYSHDLDHLRPLLYIDMDFGGDDGAKLATLTRITAYHGESLRGLAFFYADGTTRSFEPLGVKVAGVQYCTWMEQTSTIDGPGGERIIDAEMLQSKIDIKRPRRNIKMITNRSRVLFFGPTPPSTTVEAFSAAECDGSEIVTGIIAGAQMSTGCIMNMSSYGMPNAQKDVKLEVNVHAFSFIPCALKPKDPTPYYHTLSLDNIRKISISAGGPGTTRGSDQITGLCFEFYDSPTVYTGPHFKPVAAVEFERGDRIVGMTFWQTEWQHTYKRGHLGILAGISIDRIGSSLKQWDFFLQDREVLHSHSYFENAYESLHALVWSYTIDRDDIQVLTRASRSLVLRSFQMQAISGARCPSRLLWEEPDETGTLLPVTKIHVFFNETRLSGLAFEYQGGLRREAGHITAEKQTLPLREGERLLGLDVALRKERNNNVLVFHTTHNLNVAITHNRVDVSPQSTPGLKTQHIPLENFKTWKGVSSIGKCVGIWLVMNRIRSSREEVVMVGGLGAIMLEAED